MKTFFTDCRLYNVVILLLKYFRHKKKEYQLFKLYQNENMIKNYEQDLEDRKKDVAKVESKKEKAEDVVKEKKKEQGKANRDLAKVEQEIREIVSLKLCLSIIVLMEFNFRK